jgi:hypothetical protein
MVPPTQPALVEAEPELGLSEGMEYYEPEAGACCDVPGGACPQPGAYWGCQGPCRPFSSLWGDRLWVRAESLLWWSQGMDTPPLVTTSPHGVEREDAGVLGRNTSVLFGGTGLATDIRGGARFTLGYWLDPAHCLGWQASYLGLGDETDGFFGASEGDPILARPFFNVVSGEQDARLLTFDEVAEGWVRANATTRFQQLDVHVRRRLFENCPGGFDFLIGYQFNRLEDRLHVWDSSTSIAQEGPVEPGTVVAVWDLFDTSNDFHGVDFGVIFEERLGCWTLELAMNLALGNTRSRAAISGRTVTDVPGETPVTTAGGLLALPTNMGSFEDNRFVMIPELGVTLGYDLTCRLKATVGYSFIYWSKVARPGGLIDMDVNPSQFSGGTLEGAPRPQFQWVTGDYWLQGVNLGLEYHF